MSKTNGNSDDTAESRENVSKRQIETPTTLQLSYSYPIMERLRCRIGEKWLGYAVTADNGIALQLGASSAELKRSHLRLKCLFDSTDRFQVLDR